MDRDCGGGDRRLQAARVLDRAYQTQQGKQDENCGSGRGRMATESPRWVFSCCGVRCLQTRTLRVRASSPSENVATTHQGLLTTSSQDVGPEKRNAAQGPSFGRGRMAAGAVAPFSSGWGVHFVNSILDLGSLTTRSQPATPGPYVILGLLVGRGGFEPPSTGPEPAVLPLNDLPDESACYRGGARSSRWVGYGERRSVQ